MLQRMVALLLCAALGVGAAQAGRAQMSPPNRFYGSLTIDGAPAPAGTQVRAFIGDIDCTTPREPFAVPAGQYAVEVAHGSQIPGCGSDGAEVTFRVGGRTANEKGVFVGGTFIKLDLTVAGTGAAPQSRFRAARLDLLPDNSRCIPPSGESACDSTRRRLWTGDRGAWTAELAQQGKPAPTGDEVFILTYEYRIGAADPAAIASLAKGLGWPKIYVTAIQFRGSAAGEADEYIEVTNVGGAPQDMTGWRAHAVESNTDFFFSDGSVLEPGAVCRFYTGQTRPDSCPGTINVSDRGVWDDSGGSAELWYDPLALLADSTRYSADPAGQPPPPNLQGVPSAAG